jgi:hypothetical protein
MGFAYESLKERLPVILCQGVDQGRKKERRNTINV